MLKLTNNLDTLVIISCKFTSILTFITDPTQEVARHFTKKNLTWQMFSLLHLTSSLGCTSLITTFLLHYCFYFAIVLTIQQISFYEYRIVHLFPEWRYQRL